MRFQKKSGGRKALRSDSKSGKMSSPPTSSHGANMGLEQLQRLLDTTSLPSVNDVTTRAQFLRALGQPPVKERAMTASGKNGNATSAQSQQPTGKVLSLHVKPGVDAKKFANFVLRKFQAAGWTSIDWGAIRTCTQFHVIVDVALKNATPPQASAPASARPAHEHQVGRTQKQATATA